MGLNLLRGVADWSSGLRSTGGRWRSVTQTFGASTDPEPVKLLNTQSTQQTFENLPADVTVENTVTGVNDAGEGPASEP